MRNRKVSFFHHVLAVYLVSSNAKGVYCEYATWADLTNRWAEPGFQEKTWDRFRKFDINSFSLDVLNKIALLIDSTDWSIFESTYVHPALTKSESKNLEENKKEQKIKTIVEGIVQDQFPIRDSVKYEGTLEEEIRTGILIAIKNTVRKLGLQTKDQTSLFKEIEANANNCSPGELWPKSMSDSPIMASFMDILSNFTDLGRGQQLTRQDILSEIESQFGDIIRSSDQGVPKLASYWATPQHFADCRREVLRQQQLETKLTFHSKIPARNFEIQLDEIFIVPQLAPHTGSLEKPQLSISISIDKMSEAAAESGFEGQHILADDFLRTFFTGKDILGKFKLKPSLSGNIALLIGQPGQGKTSLTKYAVELCSTVDPNRLVFRISIHKLDLGRIDPPEIKMQLQSKLVDFPDFLESQGKLTQAEIDNSYIILDGLDEVFLYNNVGTRNLEDFIKRLHSIFHKSNSRILLTCRENAIDLRSLVELVPILKILPFDLSRQKGWAQKFAHKTQKYALQAFFESTTLDDPKQATLVELLSQPVLLFLVAFNEIDISNIGSRLEIYHRVAEVIFEKPYDPHNNSQIPNILDINTLKQMIWILGGEMMRQGTHAISLSEWKNAAKGLGVQAFDTTSTGPLDPFRGLITHYFLSGNKTNGRQSEPQIEFLHRTLQEYASAELLWLLFSNRKFNSDHAEYFLLENQVSAEVIQFLSEIVISIEGGNQQDINRKIADIHTHATNSQQGSLLRNLISIETVVAPSNPPRPYNDHQILQLLFGGNGTNQQGMAVRLKSQNLAPQMLSGLAAVYFEIVDSTIRATGSSEITISHALFGQAKFKKTKVEGVNFIGILFTQVTFTNSIFENVRFESCIFQDCKFDACFFNLTSLEGVILRDCIFNKCTKKNTLSIANSNITRTTCVKSDFGTSSLRNCFLSNFNEAPSALEKLFQRLDCHITTS
jgi:Pentapeptide repeats (9 copies)/NACHT domain